MARRLSSRDFSLSVTDCPILQFEGWNDTLAQFETAVSQMLGTALPTSVGETVRNAGLLVLRVAPRRFWLIPDDAATAPDLCVDSDLGCSVFLGEGRVRLEMRGARTAEILAACVAVDWHAPAATPGRAQQTSLHHVPVLFIRTGETDCDLIVPRSFAQSITEWIDESSR